MQKDRRNFYRILYPDVSCPKLLLSGYTFNVIDISEEGLRFNNLSHDGFKNGLGVSGSVTFPDGESFLIYGEVKRVNDKEVSISLKRPIPLRKIVEEQRRMLEKFPHKKQA